MSNGYSSLPVLDTGLLGLSCTAVALDVRLGVLESDAKVLLPTVSF
ncbi:hypothetical protein [Streptomyces sp. CPS1]